MAPRPQRSLQRTALRARHSAGEWFGAGRQASAWPQPIAAGGTIGRGPGSSLQRARWTPVMRGRHGRLAFQLRPVSCIRRVHRWARSRSSAALNMRPVSIRQRSQGPRISNIPVMNRCTLRAPWGRAARPATACRNTGGARWTARQQSRRGWRRDRGDEAAIATGRRRDRGDEAAIATGRRRDHRTRQQPPRGATTGRGNPTDAAAPSGAHEPGAGSRRLGRMAPGRRRPPRRRQTRAR